MRIEDAPELKNTAKEPGQYPFLINMYRRQPHEKELQNHRLLYLRANVFIASADPAASMNWNDLAHVHTGRHH